MDGTLGVDGQVEERAVDAPAALGHSIRNPVIHDLEKPDLAQRLVDLAADRCRVAVDADGGMCSEGVMSSSTARGHHPSLGSERCDPDGATMIAAATNAIVASSIRRIAMGKLGLGQTTAERATLQFTVPADHILWATAACWAQHTDTATVDPVIAAWDVRRAGGPDAAEAVERIRDLVLRRDQS